eukprot:COSAG02_NODE_17877_length_970_cov_1.171429_2_plen_73_part_00
MALQLIDDKVSVMADLGFLMIGKIPRCTVIGSFQVPRHLHQYSHPHPAHAHAFAITSEQVEANTFATLNDGA